jgi:hypothetical protein
MGNTADMGNTLPHKNKITTVLLPTVNLQRYSCGLVASTRQSVSVGSVASFFPFPSRLPKGFRCCCFASRVHEIELFYNVASLDSPSTVPIFNQLLYSS